MARKVTVALQDDLDGGPAERTVQFAINGAGYEIDLSGTNAAAFREQLTPFIEYARKAGPGPARSPASRQLASTIRAWARENGMPVRDRGRIPASVIEQYQTAATTPRAR